MVGARMALPAWSARAFVLHTPSRPYLPGTGPGPGVIVSDPLDPALLVGLPNDIRADTVDAAAAAVRVVDGIPLAVCAASDLTETLWDVGTDTVAGSRRQGHATATFRALAAAGDGDAGAATGVGGL